MSLELYRGLEHRHRRTLLVVMALTVLSVAAILAYLFKSSYDDELKTAESTTRNYAAILQTRIDTTLRQTDATLLDIAGDLPLAAMHAPAAPAYAKKINAELHAHLRMLSEIDNFHIFDANGDLIYYSELTTPPHINIADRRHFREVRDNPQSRVIFSDVLFARFGGRQSLFAARAVRDAQGRFRGTIIAMLNFDFFQKLFRSLDIGNQGSISWRRSDNSQLVMRIPPLPDLINKPLSDNNMTATRLAAGERMTTQHIRTESDGVERIISSHVLENYPFYVAVAFARSEVLAAWRTRSLIVALCSLLLFTPLFGLLFRLWRIENSLLDSEADMRATFEQAAAGIAHIEIDRPRILRANDRYCELLGYSRDELLALDITTLSPPDELPGRDTARAQILSGEIKLSIRERSFTRKDGGLLWVERSLTVVRDTYNAPKYFLSVIVDITARKRAEAEIAQLNAELETRIAQRTAQLAEANHELSSFSYAVAHDLRAPLRAINGYSAMVLAASTNQLDPTAADYLRRIVTSGERMGHLIDDLLNLARLTRQEMRLCDIRLSEMATLVASTLAEAEPVRNVAISVQPNIVAHGDPGLLRAVMENLIGNAWKFTAKTGAASIAFGTLQRDAQTVYFVRDNGVGFDMQYANKLFVPFQRLHHADEFDGTGIGLATVKRIIDRHHGKIWLESAPDRGTTVYFTLGTLG